MSDKRPPAEVGTASASEEATNQQSWKLTLPCTKAEVEAIATAEIDGAVLVTTEEDEGEGRWRLDAYFEGEPEDRALAAVRALVAAEGGDPAPLPDEDWLTLSQAGLKPIREGRFVVHTAAHPVDPPPGGRAFLIEAGQAFGTGHHETTAGCLAMLDWLETQGQRFAYIADIGTGTGILAFAATELWPDAQVIATDNDPVAIQVTSANATLNGVATGEWVGQLIFGVLDGARDMHSLVAPGVRFELVIANILAGPLIAMSAEIAAIAAPGAAVVLAGLLTRQADEVLAAYGAQGCAEERRVVRGDWTILLLRAGNAPARTATEETGRGDWAIDA